jgi:hypothetical protein
LNAQQVINTYFDPSEMCRFCVLYFHLSPACKKFSVLYYIIILFCKFNKGKLTTQEVEIRRILVLSHLWKKFLRPTSHTISVYVGTLLLSRLWQKA